MGDFTKELVDKLKEARQKKNLSQRDLSLLSGVAQEMISRIENGRIAPTVETIGRLAKALGFKLELKEDDDKEEVHE